jgi:hypothetical protein
MKLRIVDDSIRLRLTVSEVASVARGATVESRTRFPAATLDYALRVADVARITASFDAGCITVTLPQAVASRWANGNDVSLHGEQETASGALRILVEKDFTCVEPRDGEDQTDLYPNPKSAAATLSDD